MSDIVEEMEKRNHNMQAGKVAIDKAIDDNEIARVHELYPVLADIIHERLFDDTCVFRSNGFDWVINRVAGKEIARLTPKISRLCAWLVDHEYVMGNHFDEIRNEDYAVVMLHDEKCTVLLCRSGDFTYAIKIDKRPRQRANLGEGNSFEIVDFHTTSVHIRMLSSGDNKFSSVKKSSGKYKWLGNLQDVSESSFFKYGDERDTGCIISSVEDEDGDWSSEGALSYFPMLCRTSHHLEMLFAITDTY